MHNHDLLHSARYGQSVARPFGTTRVRNGEDGIWQDLPLMVDFLSCPTPEQWEELERRLFMEACYSDKLDKIWSFDRSRWSLFPHHQSNEKDKQIFRDIYKAVAHDLGKPIYLSLKANCSFEALFGHNVCNQNKGLLNTLSKDLRLQLVQEWAMAIALYHFPANSIACTCAAAR